MWLYRLKQERAICETDHNPNYDATNLIHTFSKYTMPFEDAVSLGSTVQQNQNLLKQNNETHDPCERHYMLCPLMKDDILHYLNIII